MSSRTLSATRAPRPASLPLDAPALASVLFFLSGTAALLYQMAFLRELLEWFGSTAQATGAVVGAFLACLMAGALAAALWIRRVGRPLRGYAILELTAAAGGALAAWMLPHLQHLAHGVAGAAGSTAGVLLERWILSFALMLIPVGALGATLPLLAQFRSLSMARARAAGGLQTANTLGAVAGTLLGSLWALGALGIVGTLVLAAVFNGLIAMGAWWLARFAEAMTEVVKPRPEEDPRSELPIVSRATAASYLLLSLFTGAIVVAMEVLLFRGLIQLHRGGQDSLGVLLAVFLLGNAAGNQAGVWLTRRSEDPQKLLITAQWCVAGSILWALHALFRIADASIDSFWWSSSQAMTFTARVAMEAVVTLIVVGPVAASLGLSFPCLAQFRPGGRRLGSWVAWLSACWTAGAVLAGLCVPMLLALWGMRGALFLCAAVPLAGAFLVIGCQGFRIPRGQGAVLISGSAALLLLCLFPAGSKSILKDPLRFYRAGTTEADVLVDYGEDAVANVAIVQRPGGERILKVNNHFALGGAGSSEVEEMEAILPAVLAGEPKKALVLGVGAGVTVGGLRRFGLYEIDAVEIVPTVREFLEHFEAANGGILRDPAVHLYEEDARTFVRAAREESYDLVIGDLFFPWQSEAGFLYTREHFERVRAILRPDGMFCQWLPAHQLRWDEIGIIGRTFCEVFDDTTVWLASFRSPFPVLGLVGTNGHFAIDVRRIRDSLAVPLRAELFKRHRIDDVRRFLALYIGDSFFFKDRFGGADINTADRPIVEFLAGRRSESDGVVAIHSRDHLFEFHEDVAGRMTVEGMEPKERAALQHELVTHSKIQWEVYQANTLQLRADAFASLPRAMQLNDPEKLELEAYQRLGGVLHAVPDDPTATEEMVELFQRRLRKRMFRNVVEGVSALLEGGKIARTARFRNLRGMALLLASCDPEQAPMFNHPLDLAIKDFEESIGESPELVEIQVNLGIALFLAERDEDSLSRLLDARSRIKAPQRAGGTGLPTVPEAILLYLSGEKEKARQVLSAAPSILPYLPSVWKRMESPRLP